MNLNVVNPLEKNRIQLSWFPLVAQRPKPELRLAMKEAFSENFNGQIDDGMMWKVDDTGELYKLIQFIPSNPKPNLINDKFQVASSK